MLLFIYVALLSVFLSLLVAYNCLCRLSSRALSSALAFAAALATSAVATTLLRLRLLPAPITVAAAIGLGLRIYLFVNSCRSEIY